jgi:hypothetical protein
MRSYSYTIVALAHEVFVLTKKVIVHSREGIEIVTVTPMSPGIDHTFYI